MKRTVFTMVLLLLVLPALGFQQEQEPAQQTQQGEGAQAAEPVPPPRVPGQPQTKEEWDAWQVVEQAQIPEKKELALAFLQNHPESGLTANAHFLLARYYDEIGDLEKYILHAEKTLEDLPNTLDFLARLAFYYSEQGKTQAAVKYAERALSLADQLQKPDGVQAIDFVTQKARLKSEAYYAIGRASLSERNWNKAAEYLNQALQFDPKHDYACFRLALAERNLNHAGEALMAYARAVAIGGVAAGPSQAELDRLLKLIKERMPSSEWAGKSAQELVQMAAQKMQEETNRLNSELNLEAQELDAVNTGLGQDLGVTPPPPPPPPGR